ncbi:MAG TPA: neutral zinc metallopeptidase [Planctomycetota bacterium]|nr:neutral zinc metallopeptidase [Planctomycetota bacterium]
MRWRGRPGSANVEDRRRGGGGLIMGGGIGGLLLVLLIWLLGGDPSALFTEAAGPDAGRGLPVEIGAGEQEQAEFVSVVLKDTEQVWHALFSEMGRSYREPKLVLFRDAVQSACGFESAAVGPFYCPPDERIYLDLDFFDALARRLDAPGDFAQAYVIAHEVGHHVQSLLGLARGSGRPDSVRRELQADFLAGVWAHYDQKMNQVLEPGDIEEALNAAGRIGDDVLQRRSGGRIAPDTFTHGTAAQRVRWFRRGFDTGDMSAGDTFSVPAGEL